jgi:hypothetical protein
MDGHEWTVSFNLKTRAAAARHYAEYLSFLAVKFVVMPKMLRPISERAVRCLKDLSQTGLAYHSKTRPAAICSMLFRRIF